jgi:acyl-coenzyme A thioesterase 13
VNLLSVTVSETDPNLASAIFELQVTPEICNATGMIHGGAVALIFDICTSMTIAPIAREGFWDSGHVSRTLNCTYLRPIPQGTKCTVETEIIHLGKRAGMLRGAIKNASGAVCYTCEHGKAAVDQMPILKSKL